MYYIETNSTCFKRIIEHRKLNKFLKSYVDKNGETVIIFYVGQYYTICNTVILKLCCDILKNNKDSETFHWRLTGNINTKNKKEVNKVLPNMYKYIITRERFDRAFNILIESIPEEKEIEEHREEIYRACFL